MERMINKTLSTILALASACALANWAHADETPGNKPLGGSPMIVTKDKETGSLRPATAKEMTTMKKSLHSTSASNQKRSIETNNASDKMIYHKSGMKSIVLDESHMQQLQATKNENGKLILHHGKFKPKEQQTNGVEK